MQDDKDAQDRVELEFLYKQAYLATRRQQLGQKKRAARRQLGCDYTADGMEHFGKGGLAQQEMNATIQRGYKKTTWLHIKPPDRTTCGTFIPLTCPDCSGRQAVNDSN